MIAVAFLCYWLVRLTAFGSFKRLTAVKDHAAPIGGWQWPYTTSALTLAGMATLAIFIRELIRDRREKQRMAAELAAGRAVQQVLIPEDIPTIPGFKHSIGLQALWRSRRRLFPGAAGQER